MIRGREKGPENITFKKKCLGAAGGEKNFRESVAHKLAGVSGIVSSESSR